MNARPMGSKTWMAHEIAEIPEAAQRLLDPDLQRHFAALGKSLRDCDPHFIISVARGSSDHAATCLKYAIELVAGVPVASLGPSVASVYNASLRSNRALGLAISQSGASQDLLSLTQAIRTGRGLTLALTNTPDSPLGQACDLLCDITAGPENAVAATKSYTNSVLVGLWCLARWQRNDPLLTALETVPNQLQQAFSTDVTGLATELAQIDRLVVLGRGPALGIAQEIALKAMEVCEIPATAYSSAEVLHGPSAIIKDGFPVLAIGDGKTGFLDQTLDRLTAQGARVIARLHPAEPAHIAVPPLDQLVVAYRALEMAARQKGKDPDKPPNLRKVTLTV